jgi:phosphatidylserine/phosphatidylglycerophosphate/cardiolipin synthase-like enzyme
MEIIKKFFYATMLLGSLYVQAWTQVLFRPKHDVKNHLIKYIEQESQAVYCAMYVLSDKQIAQALVDAYERGVKIDLILDQYSWTTSFGKGRYLRDHGISFLVFAPDNFAYIKTLMHAKMFVFVGQGVAWSGSYNCTRTASTKNLELVTVTDEKNVIESFIEFFHLLEELEDIKRIEPVEE